jgi:type III pantothenate kinase
MKTSLVADVGNSRIKWGLCSDGQVSDVVALPAERLVWQQQLGTWNIVEPHSWVLGGVHPARRDSLAQWLLERGHQVRVLDSWKDLPLRVSVEQPKRVGMDRLFNAVAALHRTPAGESAVIVDAGSAVTVDWLDERRTFRGGAIFPGFRLMAQALRDYTALLPLVEVNQTAPPLPGTSTVAAMEAGIFWAVAGGIKAVAERLAGPSAFRPRLFLTGGDASLLLPALDSTIQLWPEMTLEGIRLSAESSS